MFFTLKSKINSAVNIITILGPTASGKTTLACYLASKIQGEIISADSRQVYRDMDIGTGKDLHEYQLDGVPIPYHLIDIKEPGYKYNIAEFQENFVSAFHAIRERNRTPILCGGSGLYIETALRGNSYLGIPSNDEIWSTHNPLSDDDLEKVYEQIPDHIRINLNALTRQRKIRAIEIAAFLAENPNWKPFALPKIQPLIVGVDIDRDLRREKITRRLSERMNNGLIEEVQQLLVTKLCHDDLAYYGLEYKWVGKYLKGEIRKKELFEQLNIAIHQFAKRQMTWFRRMEKNGYVIHWVNAEDSLDTKASKILNLLGVL